MSTNQNPFTHLHVHTQHSRFDGASFVNDIVQKAADDGMIGIGISDHGAMGGVIDMYKAARAAGITVSLGMEVYQALTDRRGRETLSSIGSSGNPTEKGAFHLTLLAYNAEGYANLCRLHTRAYQEGHWHKPRVDWELLNEHSEGLVATTGCLGSIMNQKLLTGDIDGAEETLRKLIDIFTTDFLFMEIQEHGIADQRHVMKYHLEWAEKYGVRLLATNDSHYTDECDADFHDALLCMGTGSQISDPDRFRFSGTGHHFAKSAEMYHRFERWGDQGLIACKNTLIVTEMSDIILPIGSLQLPSFQIPEGFEDEASYLVHLVQEGAVKRYAPGKTYNEVPLHVQERINFEIGTIRGLNLPGYFLIVWDLVAEAVRQGTLVGPGRGSAAGCCVAYCLEITDVDPIKYDLFFERFLNPGRRSMPDIDIDFEPHIREHMKHYTVEKYGFDYVAQIGTIGTMKARSAIESATRVSGKPPSLSVDLKKLYPADAMQQSIPLKQVLTHAGKDRYGKQWAQGSALRERYNSDDEAKQILDIAAAAEGSTKNFGIHASAVVISPFPLTDLVPCRKEPEQEMMITTIDGNCVEDLGLLKMDYLGLINLTTIRVTADLVKQRTGREIRMEEVPLDDPKVFDLLGRGDTNGIFQLESSGMRDLLGRLQPNRFEDISAVVALFRPGPMSTNMHFQYADRKNGREAVTVPHPDLADLLGDTYGLMIYQELIMQAARQFAEYTPSEADDLRKACGKKIPAIMAQQKDKFISQTTEGYGARLANELWGIIEPFGDYAFNKSHSVAYARITYHTAWLKANYPTEYLSALMSTYSGDGLKCASFVQDCNERGIPVHAPDVNRSVGVSTVDPQGGILLGLDMIGHLGEGAIEVLTEERELYGEYTGAPDMVRRLGSTVNRQAMENLIRSGAFDKLHKTRKGLDDGLDQLMGTGKSKSDKAGLDSLFDFDEIEMGNPWDGDEEWSPVELGYNQTLALKFTIGSHPLSMVMDKIRLSMTRGKLAADAVSIADAVKDKFSHARSDGTMVIYGMLESVSKTSTKTRNDSRIIELEVSAPGAIQTIKGFVSAASLDATMYKFGQMRGQIIQVNGMWRESDFSDTGWELMIVKNRVKLVEFPDPNVDTLMVEVKSTMAARRIKALVKSYPGSHPVVIVHNGNTLPVNISVASESVEDIKMIIEGMSDVSLG